MDDSMSGMDELAHSLISISKQEAQAKIDSAKKEADELIESAKDSQADLLEKMQTQVKKKLESAKKERIAWAKLEAKRILSEGREVAVSVVLDQMFEDLPKLRKSKKYKDFLKSSVSKALEDLKNQGSLVIRVLKADKKLIKSAKGAKVVDDLKGAGGVIVQNKKGTISIDYTLESIFEQKKPELRKKIFVLLFGGSK